MVNWKGGRIVDPEGYILVMSPGHSRAKTTGYVWEHILVCEKALGKLLPPGAIPHHVDGDRSNNKNSNLVLCQDQAYHNLLHQRQRALEACGHANWRKCWICKQYDAPQKLIIRKNSGAFHRNCHAEYGKFRRQKEVN